MPSLRTPGASCLAVVLALALATGGVASPASANGVDGSGCDVERQPDWLSQINRARTVAAACGIRAATAASAAPMLAWSQRLERAADAHAAWLASSGHFEHSDAGGQTVGDRALAAGYRYARLNESLAWGPRDIAEVIAAWAASPEHCANLVDAAVSEMALACRPGADGRPVWVLVMGRPR